MKQNGSHGRPLIEIYGLSKTYRPDCSDCDVLRDVDLTIHEGEFVALLGVSGSGKSTLLNLISGIDEPSGGTILIDGQDVTRLDEQARTLHRRDQIGIVFQFFNLIPTLTVLENVTLPLELRGTTRRQSEQRGLALLERVGLRDRAKEFPDRLSGGEQQRVAIARALVHEPKLVLADEPTGNLDQATGQSVLSLLLELTRQTGRTLLMATHDPAIVHHADRVFRIENARLVAVLHEPDTARSLSQ